MSVSVRTCSTTRRARVLLPPVPSARRSSPLRSCTRCSPSRQSSRREDGGGLPQFEIRGYKSPTTIFEVKQLHIKGGSEAMRVKREQHDIAIERKKIQQERNQRGGSQGGRDEGAVWQEEDRQERPPGV